MESGKNADRSQHEKIPTRNNKMEVNGSERKQAHIQLGITIKQGFPITLAKDAWKY